MGEELSVDMESGRPLRKAVWEQQQKCLALAVSAGLGLAVGLATGPHPDADSLVAPVLFPLIPVIQFGWSLRQLRGPLPAGRVAVPGPMTDRARLSFTVFYAVAGAGMVWLLHSRPLSAAVMLAVAAASIVVLGALGAVVTRLAAGRQLVMAPRDRWCEVAAPEVVTCRFCGVGPDRSCPCGAARTLARRMTILATPMVIALAVILTSRALFGLWGWLAIPPTLFLADRAIDRFDPGPFGDGARSG